MDATPDPKHKKISELQAELRSANHDNLRLREELRFANLVVASARAFMSYSRLWNLKRLNEREAELIDGIKSSVDRLDEHLGEIKALGGH